MTIEEIYAELARHMINGMMIHDSMANYYEFLGLEGYAKCHEYRYMDESCMFRRLNRRYINHHNKLIPDVSIDTPVIIPDSWFRVSRFDVDGAMKKTAVKNGISMWHKWEKETKVLYERLYKELMEMGEVASAMYVKDCICDVTDEIKMIERYMLHKTATDFDMNSIIAEQKEIHCKYSHKMKEIGDKAC